MKQANSIEQEERILLSIVTVTRNDEIGLTRTLESLSKLANEPIQLIIVDASDDPPSIDRWLPLLSKFKNVTLIREDDSGIYDGMNKGLFVAVGEYVWFLNGGDCNLLENLDFITEYKFGMDNSILLGNYRVRTDRIHIHRKARKISKIKHGLPTSHQAIFYPTGVFKNIGFDLKYKMCADYESLARLYALKFHFKYANYEFAEFGLDGFSGKNSKLLRMEAKMIQKSTLGLNMYQIRTSFIRHFLMANVRAFLNSLGGKK